MKYTIFSQSFPAYHPNAHESTRFVESIWWGFISNYRFRELSDYFDSQPKHPLAMRWKRFTDDNDLKCDGRVKIHTIRAGNSMKAGDIFSPRIWSGLPYRSKQIEIAPPLKLFHVVPFKKLEDGTIHLGENQLLYSNTLNELALNDGLVLPDFLNWFPKPFDGQVRIWVNKNPYA